MTRDKKKVITKKKNTITNHHLPVGNVVYMLRCGRKTYIGATNNFARRIRQHRKEIKGGAKHTGRWPYCRVVVVVGGFPTFNMALSYESCAKFRRGPRNRDIPKGEPKRVERFMGTQMCKKFKNLPLVFHWFKDHTINAAL